MSYPSSRNAGLTHPKYRSDIDGLRAVAVLSVVAYHASPQWMRGGFTGVDIFFVISGFLISTIIIENLRRGSFSFAAFYGRRVRRIFPALAFVLVACLVAGWLLLTVDEYAQLGNHVAAGAGFVSNLLLWRESGYFDNDAATKPLLHLWSLGIEEQFYIVWPLLLWAAWKKNLNALTISAILVALSFAVNLKLAGSDPVADFYAPQARFWELLAGAALAYLSLNRRPRLTVALARLDGWLGMALREKAPPENGTSLRDVASLLGAGLLLVGLATISERDPYPSAWALLPVAGSVLLIAAGPGAWVNRNILTNRVLVWFGLISYPLYLWHWPLLSFVRIMGWVDADTPSRAIRLGVVALSILLAWLTWLVVEKPLRFGGRGLVKTAVLTATMIVLGGTGYAVFWSGGVSSRPIAREARALSHLDFQEGMEIHDYWHKKNGCFLLENDPVSLFEKNGCDKEEFPGGKKVFLIGDSYAGYLSLGLQSFLREKHMNLYQYNASFCVPFTVHDARPRCNAINDYVLKKVDQENPDIVIIFANYASYQADPQNHDTMPYDKLIAQRMKDYLAVGAHRVVIIGQIPTWDEILPDVLLRRFVLRHRPIPDRTFEGIMPASLEWDARLRQQAYPAGITYVSLKDFLCNDKGCMTMTGPDMPNDLIVQDYGHLTPAGADFISRKLLANVLL